MLTILIHDDGNEYSKQLPSMPEAWPRLPVPGDMMTIAGTMFKVEWATFWLTKDDIHLVLEPDSPLTDYELERVLEEGFV